MKTFRNVNAQSVEQAVELLGQPDTAVAGGGSDLLQLVKERTVRPDTIVSLKSVDGIEGIAESGGQITIGALTTLDDISRHAGIRENYPVLAEAAGQVGTPQIRNMGTLGGNLMQRPWCWYYRNNFPCYKNGGNTCFSVVGENEFHAIFGGGPSFIVHPSDTAPALVALGATIRVNGPLGLREIPAEDFFQLPTVDAAKETILEADDIVVGVAIPNGTQNRRSTYHKVLDREAWTHAVVSVAAVLEMDGDLCRRASIVMGGVAPIPWRLERVEAMLTGQRITGDLLTQIGEIAVEGAQPLAKNGYKIPLTRAVVSQTIGRLAQA